MGKNLQQISYRKNNPLKVKARRVVYVAMRNKSLLRKSCVECGEAKSEAHHEDYSKPLEVIWLCKVHHHTYDLALKNKGFTVTI